MATSDKGRSDIKPGKHPFSSTGRVIGGDETYGVYGAKGYFKTFQPQFKGRPLRHTEMDFNVDMIGQVIKGYRVVGGPSISISQTFTITVVNDGIANVFVVDGQQKPTLDLVRGGVYTFDQSDATNNGHQIAFKDSAGNSYTNGIVTSGTPGQSQAQTIFTVPVDAPSDLRYYCVAHGNYMGNIINVNSSLEADEIDLVNDLNKIIMFTERNIKDDEGNIIYEEDGITPTVEYVWQISDIGSISGVKGDTGLTGAQGQAGTNGAQGAQGLQGLHGLTGVKGDTGSTGAQGQAGTPAQAVLTYIFLHNTINPTASPVGQARLEVFEQNGAIVISFLDNLNTDNEFKFKGLFETGNFDITVASQSGSSFYNQYTISDAYVDFSTFALSGCLVIYAQTFNNNQVINPDPNATGNISYDGTILNNVQTPSNIFIDKWNSSASATSATNTFLNLIAVPNSVDFATATLDDQFIVIHSDIGALDLTGIITSWGATTCIEDIDINVVFTETDGTETVIHTHSHPANTKISEASFSPVLLPSLTGVITIACAGLPTLQPLPQGYTVTLRFA